MITFKIHFTTYMSNIGILDVNYSEKMRIAVHASSMGKKKKRLKIEKSLKSRKIIENIENLGNLETLENHKTLEILKIIKNLKKS